MRTAGCHFDMPALHVTHMYPQNAPVITKNERSYYTCSKLLTRTNRSALVLMYNYYQSRVAHAINRTHPHSAPRYGTQYNVNKMPWFICELSAQKYTMATSVGVADNTMPPLVQPASGLSQAKQATTLLCQHSERSHLSEPPVGYFVTG